MQEQEGGRWGVGEKNKRRIGGEGRELKRKRKRVRRVTPLRKGRKEYRHEREREREREKETVGNFAYLLYPRVSAFNPWSYARKKVPRLRNAKDTAKPSFCLPNIFHDVFSSAVLMTN